VSRGIVCGGDEAGAAAEFAWRPRSTSFATVRTLDSDATRRSKRTRNPHSPAPLSVPVAFECASEGADTSGWATASAEKRRCGGLRLQPFDDAQVPTAAAPPQESPQTSETAHILAGVKCSQLAIEEGAAGELGEGKRGEAFLLTALRANSGGGAGGGGGGAGGGDTSLAASFFALENFALSAAACTGGSGGCGGGDGSGGGSGSIGFPSTSSSASSSSSTSTTPASVIPASSYFPSFSSAATNVAGKAAHWVAPASNLPFLAQPRTGGTSAPPRLLSKGGANPRRPGIGVYGGACSSGMGSGCSASATSACSDREEAVLLTSVAALLAGKSGLGAIRPP